MQGERFLGKEGGMPGAVFPLLGAPAGTGRPELEGPRDSGTWGRCGRLQPRAHPTCAPGSGAERNGEKPGARVRAPTRSVGRSPARPL